MGCRWLTRLIFMIILIKRIGAHQLGILWLGTCGCGLTRLIFMIILIKGIHRLGWFLIHNVERIGSLTCAISLFFNIVIIKGIRPSSSSRMRLNRRLRGRRTLFEVFKRFCGNQRRSYRFLLRLAHRKRFLLPSKGEQSSDRSSNCFAKGLESTWFLVKGVGDQGLCSCSFSRRRRDFGSILRRKRNGGADIGKALQGRGSFLILLGESKVARFMLTNIRPTDQGNIHPTCGTGERRCKRKKEDQQ